MSVRRRRLILKPQARQDIRDVLIDSRRLWGVQQRSRYESLLYGAMRELIDFPKIGPMRDDLAPGCRSRQAGQHVIYYQVSDAEIVILRVLHSRRDAGPALREAPPR